MKNNYLIKEIEKGSFYFPIAFRFLTRRVELVRACYDTGCAHSCISYNLIADKRYRDIMLITDELIREKEKQEYVRKLKIKSIFNPRVLLCGGFGVESQDDESIREYRKLSKYIHKINKIKQEELSRCTDIGKIQNKLKEYITSDILDRIIGNKNVKYEYKVTGYTIVNMYIGDTSIHIDYDHDNVALIGMHVIKDLDTRIFPTENGICLVATTEGAETLDKLVKDILNDDEYIDFSEQDYEANYVKSLI